MKKKWMIFLVMFFVCVTLAFGFTACADNHNSSSSSNTAKTYTVRFSLDNGEWEDSQLIKEGELVVRPNDPTKGGYIFVGWDFDFSTPITQDITINAQWQIRTELIRFAFTSTATTCTVTGLTNPDTIDSLVIPNCVTNIGDEAFQGYTKLTTVTFPDSVTSIGSKAFEGCTGLITVTIPNSVTSIGYGAFQRCTKLKSVAIPDSVTNIGSYAFYNCETLTNITISNGVKNIGSETFRGTGYYDNTKNWENGVLYIGNCLIKAKKSLSGMYTIKSGTTIIADDAFHGCEKLTNVTIPNSLTSIGSSAFTICGLTHITIPNSVTNIGASAFAYCDLIRVEIGDNVKDIGTRTFSDCTSLMEINVSSDNMAYQSINGDLYSKDGKTLIQYAIGKQTNSFTVPNGVTNIQDEAFYMCKNLTSVTIPESVTSIGKNAFEYCRNLIRVTLSNGLRSIGDSAFASCGGLKEIIIPISVVSIGNEAFLYCDSLTIYCETENEPSGWGLYWDSLRYMGDRFPVYWYREEIPTSSGNYWYYDSNGKIVIWG